MFDDCMLNSICEDVLAARNLLNRMLEKAARNGIIVNTTLDTINQQTIVINQVKNFKLSDIPCIRLIDAAGILLNGMIELAVSKTIEVEIRLVHIISLKTGLREYTAVEALPKREF